MDNVTDTEVTEFVISMSEHALGWEKGLTEMQENMFSNQPVKCKLETKEVTVVKEVTTIVVED